MSDPITDSGLRRDAALGRMFTDLLVVAHLASPRELTGRIVEHARPLGVREATIYLADLQRWLLKPVPSAGGPPPPALSIESTLAGHAYRARCIHHRAAGTSGEGPYRVWLPLLDGIERMGVLEVVVDDVREITLDHCRTLASLVGLIVAGKLSYSDTYHQVRRSRPMTLQAETVWAFMPPQAFATEQVLIAAAVEPAYDVGGDAFDYSLMDDRMHVTIFDAVGHDLAAGLITSVAMAACRNTRRSGGGLTDIVAGADHAIADQFGESRFVTALLCELNVFTGRFTWIPCGHPPPLLIRDNKVIKELLRVPRLPLGLIDPGRGGNRPPVYTEQLQPCDRLLLYSDGVVEARAADGTPFGLDRLADFVIRHEAAGLPVPETLRRLNHAILDHQHGRLSDDATTILLEWMPDQPRERLTV